MWQSVLQIRCKLADYRNQYCKHNPPCLTATRCVLKQMIIKLDSRIAPTQWGIWDNGRFYFWSWATFHKNAIVSGGGREKRTTCIYGCVFEGTHEFTPGIVGLHRRPIGRLFLSFSCIFNSFEHRDTERGYTSGDNIHNNVNYSRACTGPAAPYTT